MEDRMAETRKIKTLDFLTGLDQRKEDNEIEAKAAQGGLPDTVWDSYSSFANTEGGLILLGVAERKDKTLEVKGLQDAYKMKADIWNMLNNRQKISVNLMTEKRVEIVDVNGKEIIVLDVPRADRSSRPVYKGLDPRTGTYRRNGEGDYLCSLEEVSAMFRDAALVSQDNKVMQAMRMDVFCQDTIGAYRQIFKATHSNHSWNQLEDEIFLRNLGAIRRGEDGEFHPTAAGLLMFGYEWAILAEFPQYFLDYQQNRQAASVRWSDRFVSSSGEWSGNVFDFVLKVVPKLTEDLKRPFVMRGVMRIDDTPIHKILREATVNACVHADYYGRQGVVIQRQPDGFLFANPGGLRIARISAIEGGISDPRNGVMLKMFSLINYGERAGSGLSTICKVWERIFHHKAEFKEQMQIDRVTLLLPGRPEEEDVKAMLQLYDDPEELTLVNEDETPDVTDKFNENVTDVTDNVTDVTNKFNENVTDSVTIAERQEALLKVMQNTPTISASQLAAAFRVSKRTILRDIELLKQQKRVARIGSEKSGEWKIL